MMKENGCKSLRFDTMSVIITRFGRNRRTLECGLHDLACVANVLGEGEGRAPNSPNFFLLPSLPLPFPDVFCESLFFRIKMASAVKRLQTVALSAERELISLQFINFNRNAIRLPRKAFSISKAKTLKLYAMKQT